MRPRAWWLVGVLAILVVLPWLVDLHPDAIDLTAVLQPPSRAHLFGTDENGRDALRRLLAGAQLTIGIGLASAAIAVATGSLLGAIAGNAGHRLDTLIMRMTDLALALPTLFVILVCSSLIDPGVPQLVLLIGLTGWMPVTRVVRGSAREINGREFVTAAWANGAGRWRIVLHHLLPNLRPVIAVTALLQLSRAILTEATVSFLGIGVQPPEATWGSMLTGAQSYLLVAPWLALAPGLAITLTLVVIGNLSLRQNGHHPNA